MSIKAIQASLQRRGLDGWLLCDFHNRDATAYRVLGLDETKHTSRRWFCYVPAKGEPTKIISKVEPARLDGVEGAAIAYHSWKDLHRALSEVLIGSPKVAMGYSPNNDIPYVATVDAGTIELVRSFGAEVVSSANLVQEFEALLDEEGFRTHVEAGARIQRIKDDAFERVGEVLRSGGKITELELQRYILDRFDAEGLDPMDQAPIVGVGGHPADPHFEPTAENTDYIKKGDTLLIDLWAKLRGMPGAVFYDITWCAFVGSAPPAKYVEIFDTVCRARDACLDHIRKAVADGGSCLGCDADDACRAVVEAAGYGEAFVHRTGHSIGEEVHGVGANLDNLETRDDRSLVPGCCFSIEPGIYLEGEMAVRTEIDGFIKADGEVVVVGAIQKELVLIDV